MVLFERRRMDANTPDGYHVDAKGVWDGDAVTESEEAAE